MRSTLLAFFFSALSSAALAVDVPFQVHVSSGTIAQMPSPASPIQEHNMITGSATIDGVTLNYTGIGKVVLLGAPDPVSGQIPFKSEEPFLFDFGGGDTLKMHYGHTELGAPNTGLVTLTPLLNGSTDVTWLATFNPVPNSGTGRFLGVTGGAIFMTARQFGIDLAGTNVPYSWSSDQGYLTYVPEPTFGAGMVVAALFGIRRLAPRLPGRFQQPATRG